MRDLLLDLIDAFTAWNVERVRTLVARIAEVTGPHFRYEEEALYPALVQIFGSGYVEHLLRAHDFAIRAAERLLEIAALPVFEGADVEEGIHLARGILPHVSDCDGLSIMVERLPEEEIQAVLDARERSRAAGLNLLRWAAGTRARRIALAA